MLKLTIYQVDAFTDKHFSGNPACVCLLNKTLEEELMQKIASEIGGVIVTSKSKEYDFISRYFAPWVGVDEDPVTGSAHTVLAPYWAKILGKSELRAYQASKRGGKLIVKLKEKRVKLIGKAVTVLKGELIV